MLPGDSEPAPPAPTEEAPDAGEAVESDAPTAVADDDSMLPLPDDSSAELPGGDEEVAEEELTEEELAEPALAEPAPDPAPEGAPTRHHRRAAAADSAATTPVPVDPAPDPDASASGLDSALAAGSDPGVLMKSLPVVKSAERVPLAAEMAVSDTALGRSDPDPVPFDRRGPVAASVVLIFAALAAHGIAAWRRRPSRYWAA